MKLFNRLIPLGIAIAVAGCDSGAIRRPWAHLFEAWDSRNDPLRLDAKYMREFSALPLSGTLSQEPWSDWYWPTKTGGIAYRWQTSETPFEYKLYTADELKRLSADQIKELSPAEKYDLYRGDYAFSTVISERDRTTPDAESWEGLCHGWAPAAYLYAEPNPVVVTNDDGIKIPFGSADVKALLTYFMAEYSSTRVRFLGTRCNVDLSDVSSNNIPPECRDANAGAFHVALTNQIGLMKRAFVADVTRDLEVWNQPVSSYSSEIVEDKQGASPGAAPGTVREVTMRTSMGFTVEISPLWEPVLNSFRQETDYRDYEYRVEIDNQDKIIGGEWLSDERPDFLWIQEPEDFYGEFSYLDKLYKASLPLVEPTPTPTPEPIPAPTPEPTPEPAPT